MDNSLHLKMKASNILEQISLHEKSPTQFVSRYNGVRMGNTAPIAYGGSTLAVALYAAYQQVNGHHHLYSATGSYLGPADINLPYIIDVDTIRSTKTFVTIQVLVYQKTEQDVQRRCLIMLADFHRQEPSSVLTYSTSPVTVCSKPEDCEKMEDMQLNLRQSQELSEGALHLVMDMFEPFLRFFDLKPCPEGFWEQTRAGLGLDLQTTQDKRSITSRTSNEHFRSKVKISTEAEQIAALAFVMDAKLSFIALAHDRRTMFEVGACSSLNFAFRVFTSKVDINDWILKESRTITAREGRTYSEARAWDREGTLIASMTQQCILRPSL